MFTVGSKVKVTNYQVHPELNGTVGVVSACLPTKTMLW
jgi:hypothetical protein